MKYKKLLITIPIALIFVALIIINNFAKPSNEMENTTTLNIETTSKAIYIDVDIRGEIYSEGEYKILKGTKLYEVFDYCGGLNKLANIDNINLAQEIFDGAFIYISSVSNESYVSYSNQETKNKININKASREELETIPGIGPVLSLAIYNYRINTGAFVTIDDIKNVKGIGDATFEKIKEYIKV